MESSRIGNGTVKRYLSRLRALEAVIAARKKLLDRLKAERTYLSGVAYDRDKVQTTPDNGATRESDRLIDLERDIAKRLERSIRVREQIIGEIWKVDNPHYVTLLLHRYIHGKRFEEIACEMGYSYVRVTHMHGEALKAFADANRNRLTSFDKTR